MYVFIGRKSLWTLAPTKNYNPSATAAQLSSSLFITPEDHIRTQKYTKLHAHDTLTRNRRQKPVPKKSVAVSDASDMQFGTDFSGASFW